MRKESTAPEIQINAENHSFAELSASGKTLIGRVYEIQKLNQYLNDAAKGNGSFVVLNGEAGIGKSALMHHFARQAEAAGFLSFQIRFRDFPFYDPYQSFLNLVYKMAGPDLVSDQFSSEDYAKFNAENNHHDPDSLLVLQEKFSLIRQFILAKIFSQAQKTPMVIIFDDLHLASQTTWQFIHYLTGKVTEQKVLILATLRQDGREQNQDKRPPYADIIKRMNREGIIQRIRLRRFTRENIRRYLSGKYSRSDFSSDFVSLLHKTCNGIPAKLINYVNVLERKGLIYCEYGIWYNDDQLSMEQIGAAVLEYNEYDHINDRITELSPVHANLLKYAALLNDSFDHITMAELTNRPKMNVLKDLIFLTGQKFLLNLDDDRFQFKHTEIQLAIRDKINARQAQTMHRRIAASLERLNYIDSKKKVYLLAHHFSKAGNKKRAFQYLVLAGNFCMQNLAFPEARTFYQHALAYADTISQTKKLVHLYLRCAWNDRLVGLYEQSLVYTQKALQLSQKDGKNIDLNLILLQQGFSYFRLRQWENAITCFQECMDDKNNLSLFSQATAHYGLASVNFELGNYKFSRAQFEAALLITERINSKPAVLTLSAKILNNLGALESVTGNHMQAIRRYSQSIPLYQKFSDHYGLAQVYNNIALTYAEENNWVEANKSYGKSLGYCDLTGNLPLKSIVFLNRACALAQLNRIEDAEEYNIKAHRLIKKLNDPLSLAEYHKIQGIIERRQGHRAKAIDHFDQALEKFKALNNNLGYAESAYERGLLAQESNDKKGMDRWFRLAIRIFHEMGLGKKAAEVVAILNSQNKYFNSAEEMEGGMVQTVG